jgi:hypothetical protein
MITDGPMTAVIGAAGRPAGRRGAAGGRAPGGGPLQYRSPMRPLLVTLAVLPPLVAAAAPADAPRPDPKFPRELVEWVPYPGNPLFAGTGRSTWDREIRERGFILREGKTWRLWYTGYDSTRGETKALGYATSTDGIRWRRYGERPVFDGVWTEDVFVAKHDGVYQMFAEGRDDVAHRLTSTDGVRWTEQGSLDIRQRSGEPIGKGAFGTPSVVLDHGTWHLFYERDDKGVWLATSRDLKVFTNVQDEPVIALGPGAYDRHAIALDQVVRYRGRWYGVYHANADPEWKGPWTTCLAVSDDLVRWEKYAGNPVIASDDSSGVLVDDGRRLRLYTMHPVVKLWLPKGSPALP